MKHATIVILLLYSCNADAQTIPAATMEQQVETLTEHNEDAETTDDAWIQQMEYLKLNPLNLNMATETDLQDLQILNALQVENFINYRILLGKLISIYELQAIPGWDVQLIQKLQPYITVDKAVTATADLSGRLKNGNYSFLLRYSTVIERSEGYRRRDASRSFYAGDPSRVMFRYKYQYKNLLQYGLTAAKDAGEQFFKGSSRHGFDFYSFHLFARNIGMIKAVALGDYTLNMGQGLVHWQGLVFGKGGEAINIKRQSAIIRPYNSAGAFYFNRGGAITLGKNNWQATVFTSIKNVDANITATDTLETAIASSLQTSGYHRTQSEIENKAALQLISYGGNISYKSRGWHIGINTAQYHFNKAIQKRDLPYNLFALAGKNWLNYSADYSYTFRNIHFFGETAFDKNKNLVLVNGLLISADKKVDISLLHRKIAPAYQSVYGNAFTINTMPTNEHGLYAGLTLRPVYKIRVDAYADLFRFNWLKYRVDAPSQGQEYFIQVIYTPVKFSELIMRYRSQAKPINNNADNNALHEVVLFNNRSWRTQINYQLNKVWSMRHRFELLWYTKENNPAEKGFLSFLDVFYKPKLSKYSANMRLQYFESNSYNSRLYAYENDVLYYYAIPVFYDTGFRYYFNIKCNINKATNLWLKWAQTIYSNKTSIGSGLDEIQGNKKSEIRVLISANF